MKRNRFDRHVPDRAFTVWFIIVGILATAMTSAIIWAVIQLVNWLVTK